MPTYQYACTDCGHAFDTVQSFSDDSLTVCPECGGRLRKVFNAVGVVFKGSGFYRNDSRVQTDGQKDGQQDGQKKDAKEGGEKTAAASETSSNGSGSTSGSGEKKTSSSGSSGSSTPTPTPAA